MTRKTTGKIIRYSAVGIDVLVPLGATVSQFPIWIERSAEATVSGLFVVFAFLSCLPFLRQIKEYLKSPSVAVLWAVAFFLFLSLQSIINEMVFVCFFGMISNTMGAGIYKIGEIVGRCETASLNSDGKG